MLLNGREYQLAELELLWGPLYESVLTVLGSTGIILPIGDPKHGKPDATTFTTVGEEQVTFTWSEAPGGATGFDTPLDLTDPDSFKGFVPKLTFNGTDEEADSPDAAYWSQGDGSNDAAFSVGAWLQLASSVGGEILCKDQTSNAEWRFFLDTGKPVLLLHDDSAGVNIRSDADSAISNGTPHLVTATYDATEAPGGIDIYVDGAVVASTDTDNGSYVAMEDKAGVVELFMRRSSNFLAATVYGGPMGPFFTEKQLSADEVRRLYEVGRRALAL